MQVEERDLHKPLDFRMNIGGNQDLPALLKWGRCMERV